MRLQWPSHPPPPCSFPSWSLFLSLPLSITCIHNIHSGSYIWVMVTELITMQGHPHREFWFNFLFLKWVVGAWTFFFLILPSLYLTYISHFKNFKSTWYFIFLETSNWKSVQLLQNRKKEFPVSNFSKRIWQEGRSPGRLSAEPYYAANRNCNRVIPEKQKHINQRPIERNN